jgi:DNA-binding transcriptional LysR family regulator
MLVIFEAAMLEKSLTRAGLQLGMALPSVSHALARLRGALKDQLVVRMPDGLRPTPRAERMLGPVRSALRQLRVTRNPMSSMHLIRRASSQLQQTTTLPPPSFPRLCLRSRSLRHPLCSMSGQLVLKTC